MSGLSLHCRKSPKNKVAQKIPEKLPKILFIGRLLQLEDEVRGRPTGPRRPLGATRGGPRREAFWELWVPPQTPLWLYLYPPTQKPEIPKSFLQKRSRSPPPSKPSFGGHQDPASAPCRRGPWPPGPSSSTLLHPMMLLE